MPGDEILGGRPPSTTHDEIVRVALGLFSRQGFAPTTVDEIAAAAGVGRRTIFRYFPSKNDIVLGDLARVLEPLRGALAHAAPELPTMEALRQAMVAANRCDEERLAELRIQMTLITRDPVLQAHAIIRYAGWRRVVAEFAAARSGCRPDELMPQAVGYAALGTTMAAYTRWVRAPAEDLERCIDDAFRELANGFTGNPAGSDPPTPR